MTRPKIPRLLAISDRPGLGGPSGRPFADWLRELVAAGVPGLQVRDKDLGDRERLEMAVLARQILGETAIVLVNGRIDLALAAGCQGVHLPADGVPIAPLRQRFGAQVLLGRSTHQVDEVVAAAREGADYVTFGPVFPTPSKAALGLPCGLDKLADAVRCGLPVLALGGITRDNLEAVLATGAWGVAGIRCFQDPQQLDRWAQLDRCQLGLLPASNRGADPATRFAARPQESRTA